MGSLFSKFSSENETFIHASKTFIAEGPLFRHLYNSAIKEDIENKRGEIIATNLGENLQTKMPMPMKKRIFHYYLPVYNWILEQKNNHGSDQTFVLGLSAAQGCGKTTLTLQLEELFKSEGLTCATVSIDDFYLTGQEQDTLAAKFPNNPLLRYRGNAGSHDLSLGVETLKKLKELSAGQTVQVPRYDKSMRGGRGDRAPKGDWTTVTGAVDIVLFEGWSLGFQPLPDDDPLLEAEGKSLWEVNEFLKSYSAWYEICDAWMVLKVQDLDHIFDWRMEAEVQMRRSTGKGMTDEQVRDFVERYMPAYRAYLPRLYETAEPRNKPKVLIEVDKERNPKDCASNIAN
eukprot:CAMPEP_0117753612 /NCGR_PEP_ID=MMETSP0947-20121206/12335_1 /TAXON_ID=44440 /ORGANISM="Chattonella subsalsa, Strain CCMP2191" /LENGTH=343 /DNA_ID=CAMNT_0005572539 /DNA_START=239 /DNA_END=1270 /DNA_ORIENTATION=+